MPTLFLGWFSIGLSLPAGEGFINHLSLIPEPTPTQWAVISLLTLDALAIFLRIKLG